MNEQNIKEVFTGLLGAFEKQEKELFERLSEDIDLTQIKDGETFDLLLNHKFKKFLKGFISAKFGNNDKVKFTLLNHRFIENHFVRWIEKIEGSACSADKSRTIMRRLLDFHQTGKKIEWNYDGEYTYHLPKKIFTSHKEIISFFEGLHHLFYGNPERYLKYLQNYLIIKSEP